MSREIDRLRAEAAQAMDAALRSRVGRIGRVEGMPASYDDPAACLTAASTMFRASSLAHKQGRTELGALYYHLGLTYQGIAEICSEAE